MPAPMMAIPKMPAPMMAIPKNYMDISIGSLRGSHAISGVNLANAAAMAQAAAEAVGPHVIEEHEYAGETIIMVQESQLDAAPRDETFAGNDPFEVGKLQEMAAKNPIMPRPVYRGDCLLSQASPHITKKSPSMYQTPPAVGLIPAENIFAE